MRTVHDGATKMRRESKGRNDYTDITNKENSSADN